jgi:hypothetical protein
VATDSEILGDLVSDLADGAHFRDRAGYVVQASDEELATLRKYAAIARAIEAGTHSIFPVVPYESMVCAYVAAVNEHLASLTPKDWEIERFDPQKSVYRVARIGITAMLAAAPQFQED